MRAASISVGASKDARQVLLLDLPDFRSFSELARWIYSDCKQQLLTSDILLIRSALAERRHIAPQPSDIQRLIDRAGGRPIHVLYPEDYAYRITPNLNPQAASGLPAGAPSVNLLNAIRQGDLKDLVVRSQSIIASDGFLYESPAGTLTNVFLRVGNIQQDRAALDAVFFWLYPHLRNCGAILVDTWSITSIVFNAVRLLQRLEPDRTGRIRVDILPRYQRTAAADDARFLAAFDRLVYGNTRDVLVVISACMTNRLVENIRQYAQKFDGQNFRYVTLYQLGRHASIHALCDLSDAEISGEKIKYGPMIERERVKRSVVIPVDDRIY